MVPSASSNGGDAVANLAAELSAEIADNRLTLPVLPNVAAEVLSSTVDERADAARLAVLVQRDQSLATYLLRVSNSPAFRGGGEIVSLQQAIARLGMVRVREIALSISLKGALLPKGPYRDLAETFWRESLAAGLWAKEVARAARRSVEMAYLCGLLHRVGAPVVLHRISAGAALLTGEEALIVVQQMEHRAGISLAWAWALPPPVCATVEHLADPAAAHQHAEMVAVAACGALLARSQADDGAVLDALRAQPGICLLNLYPDDLQALLARRAAIETVVAAMVV